MNPDKKTGVLLVNLGTPDEPSASAVKRFLGQFLHDKRVVDTSRWIWCPILHGIILPLRSPKVAKVYQHIWMDDGSPLMVYSQRQQQALQQALNMPVELGMTYGNPSLQSGVERLQQQGVESIIVLPLYPQYSATTTAAVYDGISQLLASYRVIPEITFIRDYFQHPLYIKALAQSVRDSWQEKGQGDYLLCSYHGIPQRYADLGDVYPQHCMLTTELLREELGLNTEQIGTTFQSRFGREEWLQPYTDKELTKLPGKGVKRLDVISPAFAVDCIETVEELGEEGQELFLAAGGEQFNLVACLNDSEMHIQMMVDLIKSKSGKPN